MIWSLEEVKDKKLVTITFEKANPTWWECVEKNDKTLVDTRKIQPEQSSISDIEDPELKAQVVGNQHQIFFRRLRRSRSS